MTPEAIQAGLIQRCKAVAISRDLSPVLPNTQKDPVAGQIRFDFIDPDRENATLKGGAVLDETGAMVATVCVEIGTLTADVSAHVSAIEALFPKGQKIAITGGEITILAVPQIRSGYPDGAVWRVPVVVRYRARAT